jgi:hypothetical protein
VALICFKRGDLVIIGQFGPVDVYNGIPSPEADRKMPTVVTKMSAGDIGLVVDVVNNKYAVVTVKGTIGIVLSAVLAHL